MKATIATVAVLAGAALAVPPAQSSLEKRESNGHLARLGSFHWLTTHEGGEPKGDCAMRKKPGEAGADARRRLRSHFPNDEAIREFFQIFL